METNHGILSDYASIPISYSADSICVFDQAERVPQFCPVEAFTKDYDSLPGNHPLEWPDRFDISTWTFFLARHKSEPIGGAVLISNNPQITLLEGRYDLGLLWDLRVTPGFRHKGIGRRLMDRICGYAHVQGCERVRVETQNTNPSACKFYMAQGFQLERQDAFAYPDQPDEIQYLFMKTL